MATRMQQRRGTAAQWISTNAGAGPVLNAGEIGWESDTNKFKIGDGVNNWSSLDYFADINSTVNPAFGTSITFEGATADAFETTITVTDPTADRTITFPNASGTVALTSDISAGGITASSTDTLTNKSISLATNTVTSTLAQLNTAISDADVATLAGTETLTNKTLTSPTLTTPNIGVASGTSLTLTGDLTVQGTTTTIDSTTIAVKNAFVFEGATNDSYETTLTVTDPTADRTLTLPDATDTLVGKATTDTLTNKSISLGSNTVTSTLAQLNTAISDADVASLTGTETLTNKTLTSPVVSGLTLSDSGIVIEGSSADAFETTLTVTNPTADRTITFPDSTGTVALTTDITASNLANDSITAVKLAGDSVTSSKIQNLAVETAKINDLAVTTGKIAEGAVTSAKIADGTIVDGDINATAAIAQSKISGLTTDLAAKAPLASPTFTGTVSAAALTLSGDLTVNGTTTTINSTTLAVDDKNIVLGDVATPTDVTADGGGITLKGTTDKTFNWVDATDAWTSSEHINLASGKAIYLNGTLETAVAQTLTNKTIALGSNTVSGTLAQFNTAVTDADFASLAGSETLTNKSISMTTNTITGTFAEFNTAVTDHDLVSLTSTSTMTNKTLSSAIATTAFTLNATAELRLADTDSSHYVGFKSPGTVTTNKVWTLPAADGTAGYALTTDGSGTLSWAAAGGGGGAAFSEFMLIGA